MKVLITGGAGFIGSHLADRLLASDDEVLVLDDLSTGSMSNIEHLIGRPGFDYRIGSALDKPLVAEMVDLQTGCRVHMWPLRCPLPPPASRGTVNLPLIHAAP